VGRVRFWCGTWLPCESRQRRRHPGLGKLRGRPDALFGSRNRAWIDHDVDGIAEPMELGHLPYKKGTYESYIGRAGLEPHGKKKWRRRVADVAARLIAALEPDDAVLGEAMSRNSMSYRRVVAQAITQMPAQRVSAVGERERSAAHVSASTRRDCKLARRYGREQWSPFLPHLW
jgi:hypothetical protein